MRRKSTTTISTLVLVIALIGTLFSGYLTYYTLTTSRSACELFYFGMPSCFYGALMFAVIFICSIYIGLRESFKNMLTSGMSIVSFIGILFASYLTLYVLSLKSCTAFKIYGIPPCVYGLAMYLILLILSALNIKPRTR